MNDNTKPDDNRIQQMANTFDFPPTPDIAGNVRLQLEADKPNLYVRSPMRLAWVILLVFFLCVGSLFMVPQLRAAALRFFHIGAITIFEWDQPVKETAVLTATKPTPPTLIERLGIATEISVAEAQSRVSKAYYLPSYPLDLGLPSHIYTHDNPNSWPPSAIISVWQANPTDETPLLALYQIEVARFAYKGATSFEETAVNGQRAMWIEEPHLFRLQNTQWQEWQFVEGNVLIWWHEDDLTFRLEGADSFEDAIRIAESLVIVEEYDE